MYIKLQELINDNLKTTTSLETIINENKDEIENLRNKLSHKSDELDNLKISLDDKIIELDRLKNVEIKLKNSSKKLESQLNSYSKLRSKEEYYIKKLEEKKDVFKKVNLEVKNLNNNLLEMEYSNNYRRSIFNRLVSTFPSLYILFKMDKSNIKNSFLTIKGYKSIKKNNLLDIGYYLNNNNDIKISGRDPIMHYIFHGYKENRNPNPKFNGEYYLKKYPDVEKSHLNPLVHYSIFGLNENRKTDNDVISTPTKSVEIKDKQSDSSLKADNQFKSKYISKLFSNAFQSSQDYVEDVTDFCVQLQEGDVKLIAFYLPQFHPFPENDKWWGKGFTEWDNVTKAVPMFLGHYQPHLPVDLGFYDLRLIETQKRQIELAKQYGVFGFCYYYYWFNGKKLMETPLDNFINNPEELDIPFCLCWANENWTRRWDGNDDDILISQDYSSKEDLEFIKDLKKYINDSRYIKVDNKPLILVYKPQLLPNPKNTFAIWREYCKKEGIGELYILGAKRHDFDLEAEDYGLDGAYEFPPNYPHPNQVKENVKFLNPDYEPTVYDLEKFVEDKDYVTKEENYEKFKTVIPYWDNTPRRLKDGQVYIGNPNVYKKWLKEAMNYTKSNLANNKQFVFINAWNEWAEGAHLEPDRKYGYAYLKATAESIVEIRNNTSLSLNSSKRRADKKSENSPSIICPICDFSSATFLPFGTANRKNALCPNCSSLERHRAISLYLKNKTNILHEKNKLLHIAPEIFFYELFSSLKNIDYLSVDLDTNKKHIKEKMDIQEINYPDNTFDSIICSHVLEHVPNDTKALKELYRVLRPDGHAIILVPINKNFEESYEDPAIQTPEERLLYYGQSDHLRYYGVDFEDKLKNAGFKIISNDFIQNMDEKSLKKYALTDYDIIYDCTK